MNISHALLCALSLSAASKILVLFGPSQAGKSSFINTLAGKLVAPVGDGIGLSQTSKCEEYVLTSSPFFPNEEVRILDVPGLNDNLHNISDECLLESIRQTVLDQMRVNIIETGVMRTAVDGILMFEGLENDHSQLEQTLSKAHLLFGENFVASSLVVFSKYDLSLVTGRVPDHGYVASHGLGSCTWQESVSASSEMADNLKAQLAMRQPYEVAGMQQVIEQIEVIAKNKCASQIVPKVTTTIPVTKQTPVTSWAKRRVQKPYTEYPTTTVDDVQYIYPDAAGNVAIDGDIGGSSIEFCGNFVKIIRKRTVALPPVTKYNPVDEDYQTTTYKTETIDEMRQVDGVPRPVSDFMSDAKQEKSKAIRQKLLQPQ